MKPQPTVESQFLDRGDDLLAVMQKCDERINKPLERRISPLRTWIPFVDNMMLGFHPGKLYVCGGRPGDGKTSFATTITANIIKNSKQSVLFISTELNPEELILQISEAIAGGIPTARKQSQLSSGDQLALRQAQQSAGQALDDCRMSIMHTKSLSSERLVEAIKYHCRILNDDKISLVIVDQVNRIKREDKDRHGYAVATEHLLNTLEEVASESHVPLLLITQLNRGSEMQKKPSMANIKHSGSLEEYAHCVFLLNRGDDGQDEIIIPKNRDGRTGSVPATFIGEAHTWKEREIGFNKRS